MAKVIIEIEDKIDGGLWVRSINASGSVIGAKEFETAAQTTATYVAQKLREIGLNVPSINGL